MKLIDRKKYLDILQSCKGTPDIKVITGIRRSGKSKLLDSFSKNIALTEPNANIIKINYNLSEFENIAEYHQLEKYVEEHYKAGKTNYLLIDEVQMCFEFEKAINSFHEEEKFDIYITGSNAFLSSSDLATLFVGRTFEINVFPFSFEEFCDYFPVERSQYSSFDDYLRTGGMPGSYVYLSEEMRKAYLSKDVLNALVVRDIIQKQKIRNIPLLEKLLDYLMSNVGCLLSTRNVETQLAKAGMNADHKTIGNYIDYLVKAFAFYRVRRFDIKGMKYLNSDDKYYLSDVSFRFASLGSSHLDYGHVLENVIAIELLRRGYEVYVGKLYQKEIDFVCIKNGQKIYVQVSYDISNPSTLERELSPLRVIRDNYPKYLIARTYQPEYEIEGIHVVDPTDWLLNS